MAASIMDHRWITQPNKMTHNRMDKTNMNPARIHRPCNNCPRPGMKKLHKAAITFPDEPRPIIFSYRAFAIDKQFHADFVPSYAGIGKSMLKCLYIGLHGSFLLANPVQHTMKWWLSLAEWPQKVANSTNRTQCSVNPKR